jgi:hypothetical protein
MFSGQVRTDGNTTGFCKGGPPNAWVIEGYMHLGAWV